jgi:LmbE family N-acetylglucosaminyl deacetylase
MSSGVNQALFIDQRVVPAPPDTLHRLGATLVIAPHPDDESLGCGGTLALLRQAGYPVHVLFVSDGSRSHPNSKKYPAEALRQLRESEALEALRQLAIPTENAVFMRQPDTRVALSDSAEFAGAVGYLVENLTAIQPTTVLVPWRRDPHRDHRATWHLVQGALAQLPRPPQVIEYPIWLWELGGEADQPRADEVEAWSLDISPVMERKEAAIAAHRSQVTRLIDDDPEGFWLQPHLLRYFQVPIEIFFEPITLAELPPF